MGMLNQIEEPLERGTDPNNLFAGLEEVKGFALGVSGGPDSMALMALFAQWRKRTEDERPAVVVAVDHGLRPEAAEECAYVSEVAEHFGLDARILRWRPAAGTAISQTTAREGRYRLVFETMRRHGLSHLLLAHHRDDQAETIVMRFLNGSGLDGMAGMARTTARDGVVIVRPLLEFSKAELRAWLDRAGLASFDDPSNLDARHERTRIRQLMPLLAEAGGTVEAITRFSERCVRAGDALETIAKRLTTDHFKIDAFGFGTLSFQPVADAPAEIRIRVLRRAIEAVCGVRELRLERLERAQSSLFDLDSPGLTLSGCRFNRHDDVVTICREARNLPRLPRQLSPGDDIVWDNRFRVVVAGDAQAELSITPLGETGWEEASGQFDALPDVPVDARPSLPAVRRDKTLIVIPGLDAKLLADAGVSITFDVQRANAGEAPQEAPL